MTADVSVMVCRGWCCGTSTKHPDIDHAGQVERVSGALEFMPSVRVYVPDCLGPCERSNVMVVRAGLQRRWFGDLLTNADTDALVDWVRGGAEDPLPSRLAARQFDPSASNSVLAQPVALDNEALTDLVETILREGVGGWSLGVEGAGADFTVDGEHPVVTRRDSTIESITSQGGLRLNVTSQAAAFSIAVPDTEHLIALFLAVPRSSLAPARSGLVGRGLDHDALRAFDREAQLYDLAIGHTAAAFCVRTPEPELQALLVSQGGRSWSAVLHDIGPALVAHSPHRVIETALGRAEVYGAIPPPGGESPSGPHTHLLAEHIEVGNELPTLFALPAGWAPAAIFHPPPGWSLPAPE